MVYGMVMMLVYGTVRYGMVWYDVMMLVVWIWCYDVSVWNLGSVWYGYDVMMLMYGMMLVWYGMVWYVSMVWYGMVW